jgi:hypothetical protein
LSLRIDYAPESRVATLERVEGLDPAAWDELTLLFRAPGIGASITSTRIETPWLALASNLRNLAHLQRKYTFRSSYSTAAEAIVRRHVDEARQVEQIRREAPKAAPPEELASRLDARGWSLDKRKLTTAQNRDLSRVLSLPHAANFSVPGSGKTTVLLAAHLLGAQANVELLVVAPKNAFPAWDQTLNETLKDPLPGFTRLVGGRRRIEALLAENPRRMLITYSQLVRVIDVVAEHMARRPVHLVLDESHKVKGGRLVQAGLAVSSIGSLAVRRDILSGTPMPNSIDDLEAQFDFLYPGQGMGVRIAAAASPRQVVAPFYVRTTKHELGLPEPLVDFAALDMSDPQRALYGVVRDQVIRNLRGLGRRQMSGIARASVMRLLQVAIDPQAAVVAMTEKDPLLGEVPAMRALAEQLLSEEVSPRMDRAIELALDLVTAGRKVVLWAPFTRTIQTLTAALAEAGAEAIYGAVPSGEESDDDTREAILLRFHEDAGRQVLVANPAAGGEGISLHRVCHDAIFVGRTYNAAHYLQARDRIHRLGLPLNAVTRITVLESRAPGGLGSIDMSVRRRLAWKVDQMGKVLDDTDLAQLALESDQADPMLDDGLTYDDLVDLVKELTNGRPAD